MPGNLISSDGTYNYTYDNEGNLIQRTAITGGATRLFTYDFLNRLVEVKDFPTSDTGGTPTQDIQYTYNMLNQLVSRTVYLNGSSTASAFDAYVYDGENLAIDYTLVDGTVTLSKTYLTGLAVDQVFAQEDVTKDLGDASRVLWTIDDNEGTTRWLLDNAAGVASQYSYSPYGQPTAGDTSLTPFLYAGGMYDALTGLQYNSAYGGGRWYDPVLGRWLQQDPIGFAGGDYNLERYVGDDPTNGIDPSGLDTYIVNRSLNLTGKTVGLAPARDIIQSLTLLCTRRIPMVHSRILSVGAMGPTHARINGTWIIQQTLIQQKQRLRKV